MSSLLEACSELGRAKEGKQGRWSCGGPKSKDSHLQDPHKKEKESRAFAFVSHSSLIYVLLNYSTVTATPKRK